MNQPQIELDEEYWENQMAHLVTEDETPVDNRFSEREQHLLPGILHASWPQGQPFEALTNVGLFYSLHDHPVVPDFMLSLGVEPRPVSSKKADRSYMTWVYGKPPDLVVEVVSNTEGGELDRKLDIYARVRVTYYVVHDPFLLLGDRELRAYRLMEGRYIEMLSASWFPEVGLGLTVWEGLLWGVRSRWLRFVDAQGRLLLTAEERAELAEGKAEQAEAKVEQAEARVEQAEARVEQAEAEIARLHQKLRELGIEP
jgi:Uma2 family endonuclease